MIFPKLIRQLRSEHSFCRCPQELAKLPLYFEHVEANASAEVPQWALVFLQDFPWTQARLHSFLDSALHGAVADEPTMNDISKCDGVLETLEDCEEEVAFYPDHEISFDTDDLAEQALDRDLERWAQERDESPSLALMPDQPLSPEDILEPISADSAPVAPSSSSSGLMSVSDRLQSLQQRQGNARVFKFGSCPHHGTALRAHVWSARSLKAGRAALVCSRFWKRDPTTKKPLCWYYKDVSNAEAAKWPRFHRQRHQSLQNRFLRAGRHD